MGTEISLDVGGMAVDWSKNMRGADHGVLFHACDRTRVRSNQINYDHFQADNPELAEMEAAFARSLADIVPRLELMGFSLDSVESAYNCAAEGDRELRASIEDLGPDVPDQVMGFAEFRDFVNGHAIEDLDDTYPSGPAWTREGTIGRFADHAATVRIPYSPAAGDQYSERSQFGSLLSFLPPYAILRLLAENPANLDSRVVWHYGPLVHAGWAETAEFEPGAGRTQTFLIATEGSSDAGILKRALSLLRPNIADFFRFVDMDHGYPFTGTGNLRNFAAGLAGIDVQNHVLFVLDNDAEGVDVCTQIQGLRLPANMRATYLPELAEFEAVPCRGPAGLQASDINRRAAAIECYLDLAAPGQPPAEVRWMNFKPNLAVYQGALQKKESYKRVFHKQTAKSLADGSYDPRKISLVLDHIFSICCEIAVLTNPWDRSPESLYRP